VRARGPTARRVNRRRQRGLTVYVVVLVIAMLSAVGVFATKSASLALAQGGYVRQATQAHYMAEYAMTATLADVSTDVPGYIQEFDTFDATMGGTVTGWRACRTPTNDKRRCYKFGRDGLEARFTDGATRYSYTRPSPDLLEDSGGATGVLGTAGSLGRSNLTGHFVVEATDVAAVMAPPAGERSGGAPVAYYNVTFSAIADVSPPHGAVSGDANDLLQRVTMTVETARVHTTLGPVPAR
jgi:hypothetical protein